MAAFLALPAVVAIVIPLAMAPLDASAGGFTPWGLVLVAVGVAILGATVREFFTQGRGTLAPWDPPRRLVVTGLFAHCRNPMYIGVLMIVLGHAWTFRSPLIAGYAAVLALAFHLRVVVAEEPWAARMFPDEWPAYRGHVPRWLPQWRPWRP